MIINYRYTVQTAALPYELFIINQRKHLNLIVLNRKSFSVQYHRAIIRRVIPKNRVLCCTHR